MEVEFTCLSCTRTFSVPLADIPRTDYLSCICCGKPVQADLLDALKRICDSLSLDADSRQNDSLWHIRFRTKENGC
jgi:hypothetical protein